MPDASKMDRRIKIESRSVARDAAGGEVVTWKYFAEMWASKRDLRGREYSTAMQAERAEADTIWTIRYRTGLSPTMRMTHDGNTYDIEAIAEIGRREYLELRTKRTVA